MEVLFQLAGRLVQEVGLPVAVLIVGLAPIYMYIVVRRLRPRQKRPYMLAFALLLSAGTCAIFAICAIVLGQWG